MKKFLAAIFALLIMVPAGMASAEDDIAVFYNGTQVQFTEKNIVMNNRTLVQLRPIAEALGLEIYYIQETGNVFLVNDERAVIFTLNSNVINVNGYTYEMDVPMIAHNEYTFVPIRYLVEPFDNEVVYDGVTNTITITTKEGSYIDPYYQYPYYEESYYEEPEEPRHPVEFSGEFKKTFYYQSQPDFAFENNGRGYCWACSYAMLFSTFTVQPITPVDIANYNIANGFAGNYMAPHENIVRYFGFKFVPAVAEDSQYFGGFNLKWRGDTTLNVSSDDDVRNALREALTLHPNGVIVRYDGYPHSMLAVAFDDQKIYFSDPAKAKGQHITFDQTCLSKFKLSDITFVQAVTPDIEGL